MKLTSIIVVLFSLNALGFEDPSCKQAEDFWRLYQNCLEHNVTRKMLASSDINVHFSSEHYRCLREFGPEILSLLYQASISNCLDQVIANKFKVPVPFVELEKKSSLDGYGVLIHSSTPLDLQMWIWYGRKRELSQNGRRAAKWLMREQNFF